MSTELRDREAQLRAANRRTGLGLLAISVVFFVGFFATRLIRNPDLALAVIGVALVLYLVVAIGRHLRG